MNLGTKSKKVDRRVNRTKKFLRNAILDLIVERGEYEKIQLNEIIEQADVAKSTFYMHYRDKEDLLYDALENEVSDFLANMQSHYQSFYAPIDLELLFDYIHENPRYFKVVFNCIGTTKALDQTRQFFQNFSNMYVDHSKIISHIPAPLVSYHISNALLYLIKWWLEQEEEYSPKQMSEFCLQLIIEGVARTAGFDTREQFQETILNQINRKQEDTLSKQMD